MEILQNFWNAISTEDENLVRYPVILLDLLESYVTCKLFTTILDIDYTKKQRNMYILIMEILVILSNFLIPPQISVFVHLIAIFIIIKLVFKITTIKTILAEIIPMIISLIFESVYLQICLMIFNLTPIHCKNIIIYRIPIMLLIYLTMYLISIAIKIFKNKISIFEHIDSYRKKLLIINLIFIVIIIAMQFFILIFYNTSLPIYVTIISLIILIAYAIISIYSIVKTVNLDITKRELEQSELYNKTLELLYNNVRAFKHDFSNILTAFGGFVYSKNMEGLEKYYKKILDECHITNNLSTLNPKVINNPAIYNILATKYYTADELNINIDLQVFINLNELKLDIYEFCRILGILLDNAIEASCICEEKIINIDFRDIKARRCQVFTIENTYLNKDLDLSRLSEKGYTSKIENKELHGIGLWQVSKILKKHKNIILDSSKTDDFFKQELVIYY